MTIPWDEIDPGIRDVVAALDEDGFEPIASCQGHGEGDAWVTMLAHPSKPAGAQIADLLDWAERFGWEAACVASYNASPAGENWLTIRWWGRVPFR